MKWSWPALKATGVVHTVDTPGGRRAGFLVRSTSGVELGLIWQAGNAWLWRTPDGHHGERSSQTSAVRVLRDAHDLRAPRLPFDETLGGKLADCDNAPPLRSAREMIDGWSIPKAGGKTGSRPKPALKPRVMPDPPPPTPKDDNDVGPRIKWGVQTPDLTAAIAAALGKRRDGR